MNVPSPFVAQAPKGSLGAFGLFQKGFLGSHVAALNRASKCWVAAKGT